MSEKKRISIDPITRIEGHLRIDCEIENGVVTNAWSSGTMWRGMENIVKGADPRDAWMIMQRICGVCTTVHAIISVRAVEDAIGAKVPVNAQYIRNMILAAHSIHDHIVHFYQLSAMDWVDITAALKADPEKAADMLKGVSTWSLNSANEFRNVQKKIQALVDSGQLGIFANGYFGHAAMKLPPEVNLIAVAHYLQALECQRDANRVVALLGSKTPHIQNLAIGGVANPINLDSQAVLNQERLLFVKACIDRLTDFINQVYKVDAAVFAAYYPEWLSLGKTSGNYLSVPEYPIDADNSKFMLKGVSTWSLNSANEFRNVQKKIQALVDSGQLGIFANGYFGHAAMKLPPEVNLIAVAHYLQALECQRDANRVVALLGSKTPHIQNLAIGGVANPINLDSQAVLNQERLMFVKACIDRLTDFINQVYKVDAAVFAAYYPEWLSLGKTSGNYLSVPEYPIDADNSKFMLKGGYIENGDLSTFRPIDQQKDEFVVKGIKESGKHAWYEDDEPLEPWAGLTRPKYTGWQDDGKYSWVKAPTFYGKVVEVGPLAYLICGLAANDKPTVTHFNELKGIYEKLTGNTLTTDQLHSTLGRIIGRTVHCCAINDILSAQWQMLIDNIAKGDMTAYIKTDIPASGEFRGVGFGEVPRGMLSHWVVIKDGRIENYQAVVPSTWNAGPRNEQDQMGPYELSIIGTPVADPTKPLEVVRTIHSFDPCMSCAVHVVNTENGEVTEVKVL